MAGKRPTHRLIITDKDNKNSKTVGGAAFSVTDWGSLHLVLSPGVVLDHDLTERCFVNLNPIDWDYEDRRRANNKKYKSAGTETGSMDDSPGDDDIPF